MQQEMLAAQQAGPARARELDMEEFLNDPDLEKLHEERMAQMKREVEKRQAMLRNGHGEYQVRRVKPPCTLRSVTSALCWHCPAPPPLIEGGVKKHQQP